ncbi:MAG: hypothetical protein ABW046_05170 [Actinoplanes sp.]
MTRLYVLRRDDAVLVSRSRLRFAGGRPVPRSWSAVVEIVPPAAGARSPADTALVVVPSLLAGGALAAFAPLEAAIATGGALLLTLPYVAPRLRRRWAARGADRTPVRTLTDRPAVDRVLALADRVAATWPELGTLIDPAEAETMLTEALWEITGVLERRQELTARLTDLTRPGFTTAKELTAQVAAVRSALSDSAIDLARREASLRRAEEAGRAFARDRQMHQAIQAAEHSLRADVAVAPEVDAAADLADRTGAVLTAYRELTTGPSTP